jgi:hypothetical protein
VAGLAGGLPGEVQMGPGVVAELMAGRDHGSDQVPLLDGVPAHHVEGGRGAVLGEDVQDVRDELGVGSSSKVRAASGASVGTDETSRRWPSGCDQPPGAADPSSSRNCKSPRRSRPNAAPLVARPAVPNAAPARNARLFTPHRRPVVNPTQSLGHGRSLLAGAAASKRRNHGRGESRLSRGSACSHSPAVRLRSAGQLS